ncbi:MAG: family 20 glycosylhydrolase [Bacteroides sp.]|nr:family 20 glycosylhydrolase [Bacteroides sp.]MCM1413692.1 family 20 glycosylhydrolase [Bacteroides sp.]MCM1471871.1 family 20 glycosylhydrolase [Bacteroides sp.]
MRHIASFFLLFLVALTVNATVDILPRPSEITYGKGSFTPAATGLTYSVKGSSDKMIANAAATIGATEAAWSKSSLQITVTNRPGNPEAYTLTVAPRLITISSPSATGAFYGIMTLRQILEQKSTDGSIPCLTVTDAPRFSYRGLHFDVSRHFRPIEFLYKQADAMARLKLNRMHLHLTDGAGWRIESDSFPRLNSYAAWRPERRWTDWAAEGAHYCDSSTTGAYGGYYTKQQLKDLIDYCAGLGITIIPEIEMPGHSEEVIATYPELGCTGAKTSDFCPGKEETFRFLTTVLDETIDLFPSTLIHIGGDEASKSAWKDCPDCQRRMQENGLANVDELQSYLIKRIEQHVNSRGRRIIGWDEILEGGVAPDATVMSWRGTEGGVKAMAEGHDVIMTPGAFCYIDYSQDAPFREPASIGGYTPLSKVYSYEPFYDIPDSVDTRHLLGVQANLWSEYVTEDSHAEYMYYPRAYAIAEIGWSPAGKDYDDFHRRALLFNTWLNADGYTTFDLAHEYGERPESLSPVNHLARGAKVTYTTPYSEKYAAGGDSTLTDGILGGWTYGDKRWQGWTGDMELIVDLGETKPLHAVNTGFMHSEGAWVQLPDAVTYSVSLDGKNFTEVGTVNTDMDPTYGKIMFKNYFLPLNTEARYVRLQAKANPRPGAWLFLDEIIIN